MQMKATVNPKWFVIWSSVTILSNLGIAFDELEKEITTHTYFHIANFGYNIKNDFQQYEVKSVKTFQMLCDLIFSSRTYCPEKFEKSVIWTIKQKLNTIVYLNLFLYKKLPVYNCQRVNYIVKPRNEIIKVRHKT